MEKIQDTKQQFFEIIERCRALFFKKNKDYGPSWTILRPSSLTDQIFIKAGRVRSLQEKGVNKVGDSIEGEFIDMVNYSIVGLLLLEINENKIKKTDVQDSKRLEELYDQKVNEVFALLEKKNHDYGEAWRDMRISSMTDLILMKIIRLKQIEDNNGETSVSEGPEANYKDIFNYAVFCLMRMEEEKQQH
jgi:hypothetical protein